VLASLQVGPHDDLVMMRPTEVARGAYQPLPVQLAADVGDWAPENYKRRREAPTGIRVSRSSMDNEEGPVLNVRPAGESPEGERSGPLAWLGRLQRFCQGVSAMWTCSSTCICACNGEEGRMLKSHSSSQWW